MENLKKEELVFSNEDIWASQIRRFRVISNFAWSDLDYVEINIDSNSSVDVYKDGTRSYYDHSDSKLDIIEVIRLNLAAERWVEI